MSKIREQKIDESNPNDTKFSESKFAKKSLGQNFLKSEKALREIVEAGDIGDNEIILEIGPGTGALTEKILNIVRTTKNAKLIAIEKDNRLIEMLQEKFSSDSKAGVFKLIHGDALEILKNFSRGFSVETKGAYKVIANIPYYITGLIFRSIFSQKNLPTKAILLVQKEVAKRIVAKDEKGRNKENLLSLSVKLYGTPKIISIVPRGAFVPSPNVDSAIIAIDVDTTHRKIEQEDEEAFFGILHLAFVHKRKKLIQNLKNLRAKNATDLPEIFKKLNLDQNVRAEDLSLEQYISIFKELN